MYADAFFDAKRSAGSISVSRSLKSACRMGVNRISELFVAAPFKNAFALQHLLKLFFNAADS